MLQVIPKQTLFLYVLQDHMLDEYTIQANYVIVSKDQRYITKSEAISSIQSFHRYGLADRSLLMHGNSFRWIIRVPIGHQIVIDINQTCITDATRLCDGPGIQQCQNIEQHCQDRSYQMEYFMATLEVYREQTKKESGRISFDTTMVDATSFTISSSLTLQVLSPSSAIMHKSFQLITDQPIEINFDIGEFLGLNSDNCVSGGNT